MPTFTLRTITPEDAGLVAHHRAAMFLAMGSLRADAVDALVSATSAYLFDAIARGEYHGWFALPDADPAAVAGGAGVQLRPLLPRPNPSGPGILSGRQGIILNVFVEPPFRRLGVARLLVEHALEWSREQQLASVVLHASDAGRPLYERLGFVATNEMRFAGPPASSMR
jgi:GNAT superfamily N-acetyltransferase